VRVTRASKVETGSIPMLEMVHQTLLFLSVLIASLTSTLPRIRGFAPSSYSRSLALPNSDLNFRFSNLGQRSLTESRVYDEKHNEERRSNSDDLSDRRSAVEKIFAFASVPLSAQLETKPALAVGEGVIQEGINDQELYNIQCLLDLPPIENGCVRLFLCRHGETENNRLKKIQGARVDPPLNDLGRRQAVRLGESFSALKKSGLSVVPTVVLHSNLQRARETAAILSLTVGNGDLKDDSNLSYVSSVIDQGSTSKISDYKNTLDLKSLISLGEVDFGSVDGKSANEARADMIAVYSQWGIGRLDARNGDDGETGRSVLTRICSALNLLIDVAGSNGGSVAVVTHSTYLRMLLSLALDVSLFDAASFDQKNCCINVLDLSIMEKKEITSKSKVLGGNLSVAKNDESFIIPKTRVIRMNEDRHLGGLLRT
jgi:broad specificity phosphatase PhoE